MDNKKNTKTFSSSIRLFPKYQSFFIMEPVEASARIIVDSKGLKFFNNSQKFDDFFFLDKKVKEIKKGDIEKVKFNFLLDNFIKIVFNDKGKEKVVFVKCWPITGYPGSGFHGNQQIYGNIKRMLQGESIDYEKLWFGRYINVSAWKFALIMLGCSLIISTIFLIILKKILD